MLDLSMYKGVGVRAALMTGLMAALLMGAMAVFLMTGESGEGQEVVDCPTAVTDRSTVCINFPENSSGAVASYIATDPEMETVTWSLATDADVNDANTIADRLEFTIDSATGVLTFKTPPDFEKPTDNPSDNGINSYVVVIMAKDEESSDGLALGRPATGAGRYATIPLRIQVTNVDEPGTVTLPTLQPQVGVPINATLADPDGQPDSSTVETDLTKRDEGADTVWQWARRALATGSWTDIDQGIDDDATTADVDESEAGLPSYTPTEEDVGMYLRATATYNDSEGKDKTAFAISANPVQADPSNKDPRFLDAEGNVIRTATRSVAENSPAGTKVGEPVAATDIGPDGRQETLTYTLGGSGSDADSFDIDSGAGQITVKGKLDADTKSSYSLMVTARDPSGGFTTITVTVNVTNVDEPPTIAPPSPNEGQTSEDVEEDTPANTAIATYRASDPEGNDEGSLKWTVSGRDAGSFRIGNFSSPDERGKLYFREAPDYEDPKDSGRDNVYNVTVEVTDQGGKKATRDVTVTVTNRPEEGRLTVSNRNPQVGTSITATLTDPDTPISNVRWRWMVAGKDVSSTDTYTPKAADANEALEVEVTYNDGTSRTSGRQVEDINLGQVNARPRNSNNRSPAFPSGAETRLTISENDPADKPDVGSPVVAVDPDDVALTYSMVGGEGAFTIDQITGQISATRPLDREKRSSYRVTVTAEDRSGARDTHSLTIEVTDVDEAPAIRAGDAPTVYYAENGRTSVAAYRAEDPERNRISWSLAGEDAGLFRLSSTGVLMFKAPPNFEDSGYDKRDGYSVAITATSGSLSDTETITVRLINVDEPGTATLTRQPRVGLEVTARLSDPDEEVVESIKWQWARGVSRSGPFVDIEGETNAAYTPDEDDVRKYLRATATYTDGHGTGKTAYIISSDRTLPKESGSPRFLDDDGEEITPTTLDSDTNNSTPIMSVTAGPISREIAENSRAGANVGDPVEAVDIGTNGRPENLTYSLGGADMGKFDIDQRSGQIRVKSGSILDYEATDDANNCDGNNDMCVVTVTATDPSDNTNMVTVNIDITDVNEPPTLALSADPTAAEGVTDGTLASRYKHPEPVGGPAREDTTTDNPILSITFTATDTDEGDTAKLKWSVAGPDADDFNIPAGVLTFKSGPDYEAPTDSRRRNMYDVTVQVSDGVNTVSQRVRIDVINVGEVGNITFSHPQPEVGVRLEATLTDPDSPSRPSNIKWQWYRGTFSNTASLPEALCTDANADDCLISGFNRSSYTPMIYPDDDDANTAQENTDVGDALTVVATYRDGEGSDKTTIETTANSVVQEDTNNMDPQFLNAEGISTSTATREIREDAVAGRGPGLDVVGVDTTSASPVAATDCDGAPTCRMNTDRLVYKLDRGRHDKYFTINSETGQITARDETKLDYETEKSYTVRVTATDPTDRSATITVTINVIDVDEEPKLELKGLAAHGPGSVIYKENGSGAVYLYTASGEKAINVGWTLSGTDASDFRIGRRDGELTFIRPPNFESPADADRDNVYELTVRATSGRVRDEVAVKVEVLNVDEAGSVTLSPQRATVGAQLTATLTDPDGSISRLDWEWERSEDGRVGWNGIPGARSASYTAVADDAGHFLRAVAYYRDGEGAGKEAMGATSSAVLTDDDGVVTLSTERISVGDEVTASLRDPDGNIRNQVWRWARSESRTSGWSDISGATSASYTATAQDVTYFLRATVEYDDGEGVDKSAFAVTARAVVEDDDGTVTLSPASASVGDTVTATLTDPDGGVTGHRWLWASSADGQSNWTNISGATSSSYRAQTGDLGRFLRVTVSYTDSAGPGKSAVAVTSAAVAADDDGTVTLSPSAPMVGDSVTASLSDPDGGISITGWQWAQSGDGVNWTNIAGATGSSYRAQAGDQGRFLRVTVSYTDSAGPGKSEEGVTSAAVAPDDDGTVTLTPTTPEVGVAVTASLTDPDGPRNLRWQWAKSGDGSTGWTNISGATSASYTPGQSDAGFFLRATVTYDDGVGTGRVESRVSGSGVRQAELLRRYDANGNGEIDRSEVNSAVNDYFNEEISREQALEVITLYFSS